MLAPSDSRSGNLPAELSSFVGRDADLSQLADVQARARLLTLVGPAASARRGLRGVSRPDCIPPIRMESGSSMWLRSPEGSIVAQAVADVLGVGEEPGQSYLRTLEYRLRSNQLLLILDNCGHLVTSCAELAEALLRACPDAPHPGYESPAPGGGLRARLARAAIVPSRGARYPAS